MIALVLSPSKGKAPYPPLAICALKAWLIQNKFKATAIDLNKNFIQNFPDLLDKINQYFGRPKTFLDTNITENISNIDTIYNVKLLLKFLYFEEYGSKSLTVEELNFYYELDKVLESDAHFLISSGFKYIGFSTFVSNICYSLLLGNKIKRLNSNINIFYGGSSTAYRPIRDFMIKSRIADYVIVGEGENAIVKLISDLENNKANYSIIYSENISPKNLSNDEVKVPIIKDLDILPFPDFNDLNLDNYTLNFAKNYRFVSIATSRGCVNRCAYCSETQYWHRYRQRSVKRVVEEIEYMYNNLNARIFFFCDSLINGNVTWLKDFCKQIVLKGLNIQWMSYATLNNLNLELLQLMYKSGCVALTLGIEHISTNTLKGVNKTSSIGNTKEHLLECIKVGIFPIANIIYALPSEASDDFIELLAFTCDPDLMDKVLFTFRPYEIRVGSDVTQQMMKKSDTFHKHDFKIPVNLSYLTDNIKELGIYWLPEIEYIKKTLNKCSILSAYYGIHNRNLSLKMCNARIYNIPSILQKIINTNSIPQLLEKRDIPSDTNIQLFILSLIDGTKTVSQIIESVEYVINQKYSELETNDIHNASSRCVKNNLIKLSLKHRIIWN